MNIQKHLSPEEVARIETKIGAVERLTSAEIRVALTKSSWTGIGNKAATLFQKYGLHQTAERNGVLVLVDVKNRELLIHGDSGIDEKVDPDFWNDVRDAMLADIREEGLASGLMTGIHRIGEALCTLFPARDENPDEISNELLYEP